MTNIPDIPIEDYIRLPLPGWAASSSLAFSPDDHLMTFLLSSDRSLRNDLYAYDPDTGKQWLLVSAGEQGVSEQNISREEALRRERMRQMTQGITTYSWASRQNRLLIPLRGSLYVKDNPESSLRLLYDGESGAAVTPAFSHDGEWIAFVRDGEVWVIPFNGGEPHQVTRGAAERGATHGLAEFVAQEEMARRVGFWWSPDSKWIAFEEASEEHIPVYTIMHQGKEETGEAAREEHHYPFAGGPNARVKLGIVSIQGGEPIWMDLGDDPEIYLGRVDWFPDGTLTAQLIDREQSELELRSFNPETGQGKTILSETSQVWVNLHDILWPLKQKRSDGGAFLWASERSGFRHLYLMHMDGSPVQQLTSGEWMVDSLAGVDEDRGIAFFLGTRASPLESQLYAVSLEGGEPCQITLDPGMHSVMLDHHCRRFLDSHNSLSQPPHVTLRSLDDSAILRVAFDDRDPRIDELGLQAPELVELRNRHGDLLYGAVYRPPASFGEGPFPTIVSVYGGPHAQMVTDGWMLTSNARAQYLSRQGFLVFMLDNRGSARRGLKFEGAIKYHMGTLEVDDQVDGVHWLVEQGLADPDRVGIYGWSYGGYMTLMCLARAPETFKAGVAGAPVTAWDGYDTFYTERYMGTPQTNPDGYQDSSVMAHVDGLQGELMLVHGLIDENVHFRHTARLINALIKARKRYQLLLFPEERHSPRSLADRVFMEESIRDFFLRTLKDGGRE